MSVSAWDRGGFQLSLRDYRYFVSELSVETLGYYRWSLRDPESAGSAESYLL
jgi:hypothetical protein